MLQVDDIRVGYDRSHVLHGVTVAVPTAGITAVLGHNGAGKSTLLRAAMGLLRPKSGTVRLDGDDITRLAPHQRVARGMAYVPQGQQCFPHLTAAENLWLVADGRPGGGAAIADARALITSPRLLLLDEPTEGIQPTVVAEIEKTILALTRRGGLSVLLVEQHVGFAISAAQRYYVLEAGRVTSSGGGGTTAEQAVRAALSV